jgi:hypothetical protein
MKYISLGYANLTESIAYSPAHAHNPILRGYTNKFSQILLAKSPFFHKVVRASAVTPQKRQISTLLRPLYTP